MGFSSNELRFTLRRLARAPLFTSVAALTLALGIGANAAIFSVVYAVLIKPLEYTQPERLVGVWHRADGLGIDRLNQGPAPYLTYREQSRVFEESGMWNSTQVAITGGERPERVQAIQMTDGVFPVLSVTPQLGRLFTREDDSPAGAETVILSHGYWQSHFGGDAGALGRSLTIDGKPRLIIGVMRPGMRFLDRDPAVYLPLRLNRAEVFFGNFSYMGIARLRAGSTLEQANADVARLLPVAMEAFPMPPGFTAAMLADTRMGPNVRPLMRDIVGDIDRMLWVLFGTVGLVLLVACANVANLFLVRAESRQHELAVRSALGASRARVVRELLSESVVLAVLGGLAGLGLAWIGLDVLVAMEPRGLPRLAEIGLHPPVLLFTSGVVLLTALLFGGVAVFRLRPAGLIHSLKDESRGSSAGRARRRTRDLLVVGQVAAALVLLIGSGLLVRSFRALTQVNPGFERPEEVLTFRLSIPPDEVAEPVEVARAYERLFHLLEAIPGVSSVGMSSSITLDGWSANDPIFVEERPTPEGQIPPMRRYKWITPGYFETLVNPLVAGRAITWQDIHERAPVVVVTQEFARLYWKRPTDALGKRIRVTPDSPWREIVGVAGDIRDDGIDAEVTAAVYWPLAMQNLWGQDEFVSREMAVALRSSRAGSPDLLEEARKAVGAINSNLPLASVRTLAEIRDRSMARTSFTVVMLSIAALTALLLGAVGIYGVTSYAAAQRTREIGVRMALGARPADVGAMVLRHGLVLAGAGVAIGLAAAAGLTRLLSKLLFDVSPLDPLTYVSVAVVMAGIALVATYLPARRAAGLDPVETLRK